jgi:hypothetical protein
LCTEGVYMMCIAASIIDSLLFDIDSEDVNLSHSSPPSNQ